MSEHQPTPEPIRPQTHFELVRTAQGLVEKLIAGKDPSEVTTLKELDGNIIPYYDLLPKMPDGWTGSFFTEPCSLFRLYAPASREDPEQYITLVGWLKDGGSDSYPTNQDSQEMNVFISPVKRAIIPLFESAPDVEHVPEVAPVIQDNRDIAIPSRVMSEQEAISLIADILEITNEQA